MHGRLHDFLARDHARLDACLRESCDGERIVCERYGELRAGLLRHIGLEEKILLPAARRWNGGEQLSIARQLRADHAALAALLVPTPTRAILAQLQSVLAPHNALEEEPGGLYDICDRLSGDEADQLLARMRATPPPPLAPHFDGPRAFEGIERLLRAAGRMTS